MDENSGKSAINNYSFLIVLIYFWLFKQFKNKVYIK